jgi:hypothetical protein
MVGDITLTQEDTKILKNDNVKIQLRDFTNLIPTTPSSCMISIFIICINACEGT